MKRIIVLLILTLIITGTIYSENAIEIQTELVHSIGKDVSASSVYFSKNKIFFFRTNPGDGSAAMIDLDTQIIRYFSFEELYNILYSSQEYLIVSQREILTPRYEGDTLNSMMYFSYYYPKEDRFERIDGLEYHQLNSKESYLGLFPGINSSSFYISYYPFRDHGGYTKTKYVDFNRNEETEITDGVSFTSISPDRLNALVFDRRNLNYSVTLYNFEINDFIKTVKKITSMAAPFFITNDLFMVKKDSNIMAIYDMDFIEQCRFIYKKPFDWGNFKEGLLVHAPNSTYGLLAKNDAEGYTKDQLVLDLSNEMEILDELGLLFHPTTAVLNDDRVRMREWPLLDAKHLAFLEEGEEVEVLDRSGIKVKIGDMEDYWYNVKRADGTEGWSYGVFLDIAEEE